MDTGQFFAGVGEGVTLWWTSIPSRGGVEILLVISCYAVSSDKSSGSSIPRTGTELNIAPKRRIYYLFWRPRPRQTGKDYTGSRAFQPTDQQGTCQSPGHLETHGGWVLLLKPSGGSTKKVITNNKTCLGLDTARGHTPKIVNLHLTKRYFLSKAISVDCLRSLSSFLARETSGIRPEKFQTVEVTQQISVCCCWLVVARSWIFARK